MFFQYKIKIIIWYKSAHNFEKSSDQKIYLVNNFASQNLISFRALVRMRRECMLNLSFGAKRKDSKLMDGVIIIKMWDGIGIGIWK